MIKFQDFVFVLKVLKFFEVSFDLSVHLQMMSHEFSRILNVFNTLMKVLMIFLFVFFFQKKVLTFVHAQILEFFRFDF